MRHLLARQLQRLLPHELGDLHVERQVGALLLGEIQRPFGQQRDELLAELRHALAGLRAHGMERVEVAEPRRGGHLRGDVTGLEAIDLVQRDDDGNAQ